MNHRQVRHKVARGKGADGKGYAAVVKRMSKGQTPVQSKTAKRGTKT